MYIQSEGTLHASLQGFRLGTLDGTSPFIFSFHSVSNEALKLFCSLTDCGFCIFGDTSEAPGLHRVPEGSFMKEGDSGS